MKINIIIDGIKYLVYPRISILEACRSVGVEIPSFCFHELLFVTGLCRICIVMVDSSDKPVISCITEVKANMTITTYTPFVIKARQNVVSHILRNHPLDCAVCDQAGECDLQDQAKLFGSNLSKNFFIRKSVEDKNCGPLIKTIMTRCIACTRCVRFGSQIAGVAFFGTLSRGGSTEIGSYTQQMFLSEISGNVIDLCPVGALTSKPYSFKARPWELRAVENIDTTDSLGSTIYTLSKETEIFNVLPKKNEFANLSLISDKTRFSYDATNLNRIDNLYEYNNSSNEYKKLNWGLFLSRIDSVIENKSKNVTLFFNKEIDLQSLLYLKHVKSENNYNLISNTFKSINNDLNYYVSPKKCVKRFLDSTDNLALLIGANLRSESTLLNTRLKIETSKRFIRVYSLGNSYKDNVSSIFLHFSTNKLFSVFEGKSNSVTRIITSSINSLIVFGCAFKNRVQNYSSFIKSFSILNLNFNSLSVETECNNDGVSWSNMFRSKRSNDNSLLVGINLTDSYSSRKIFNKQTKSQALWINTHGSVLAANSLYIIPSKTNFEDENIFLNMEHHAQKTNVSVNGPSNSRSTKQILKCILQSKENVFSYFEHILEQSKIKSIEESDSEAFYKNQLIKNTLFSCGKSRISSYPMKILQKDFYLTNNFLKNSNNMLLCSEEFKAIISTFNK